MLFFSNPGPKYTPSSNRLNTGDKLIITSSVIKDVYIRPYFQVPYANIYVLGLVYLTLLWWLETLFFKSKLVMKRFHVSKLQISGLWTSLQFIRSKGIDSNNTL